MNTRRTFLQRTLALGSAFLGPRALAVQQMNMPMTMPVPSVPPSRAHVVTPGNSITPHGMLPVITSDIGDLPYTLDGAIKVFHLVAEPVRQSLLPGATGKTLDLWGFNGSAPGPTIQVTEGDHVRVIVDNHLPEPTSMHWHGFEDTIANDGMPGISQPLILPGARFVYEFQIRQTGTFFYHSHMAMQELTGMLGGFIMHPRVPLSPSVDKDYLLHLQEYAVLPAISTPDTMKMEFNWLVLNGKSGPATTPLIVRLGDRVRIRFVNLGMDHHPMHLHGHTFHTTGTEGGRIPEAGWWPGNTVLVGVAQARDIEFVANNPGDWMLHCHLPHHMMNQMTANVGPMTRQTRLGSNAMPNMPGMAMPESSEIAGNANNIPNFPQDAYMESPSMATDAAVDRPENYGLRRGWSSSMMGMMTFVRVLSPVQYEDVLDRMRQANRPNDPYRSLLAASAGKAVKA